ncbi:uncharacterized protein BDV14DRAFT_202772 [Aspergillus stella-maris]|uniref:uncharacterized protein n=1 Tax=Aspergillus stella-maris TaxID=1810926 RepID=UPI003CCD000B
MPWNDIPFEIQEYVLEALCPDFPCLKENTPLHVQGANEDAVRDGNGLMGNIWVFVEPGISPSADSYISINPPKRLFGLHRNPLPWKRSSAKLNNNAYRVVDTNEKEVQDPTFIQMSLQVQELLIIATSRGFVSCMSLLLEHGANPKARFRWGDHDAALTAGTSTIARLAVILGSVEEVQLLLELGAAEGASNIRVSQVYLLEVALGHKRVDIARQLLCNLEGWRSKYEGNTVCLLVQSPGVFLELLPDFRRHWPVAAKKALAGIMDKVTVG